MRLLLKLGLFVELGTFCALVSIVVLDVSCARFPRVGRWGGLGSVEVFVRRPTTLTALGYIRHPSATAHLSKQVLHIGIGPGNLNNYSRTLTFPFECPHAV